MGTYNSFPDIDTYVSLCNHCVDKITLNEDPYKFQAELVEPVEEADEAKHEAKP